MMPIVNVTTKMMINLGFRTRRRMIISGRLKPTTDIMKARTVPSAAPFSINTAAIGMMPAAFEYKGTPSSTATGTDHQTFFHDPRQGAFRHIPVGPGADANSEHDI